MFSSVNELDRFIYDDCVISSFKVNEDSIILELDALVVAATNTQNTNYTNSYADTATMKFENAKITDMILAGYKVYDADDNLLEEIPDKTVNEAEFDGIIKNFEGAYLYRILQIEKKDDVTKYDLEVEFGSEDAQIQDLRNDTYVISITTTKSVVSWERYLNRVQQ